MQLSKIKIQVNASRTRVVRLQKKLAKLEIETTTTRQAIQEELTVLKNLELDAEIKAADYDRKPIIARILKLHENGATFVTIAETLNREGIHPRKKGKFSRSTVYQMYQMYSRQTLHQ